MDGRVWGQLSTEKFWWFYNFRNTCAAYCNALWIFTEYQRLLHSPQGLSFPLVLWIPNGSFVQWSVNYRRKNYMQWWCGGKQWEKEDFLFSLRKLLQKWRALACFSLDYKRYLGRKTSQRGNMKNKNNKKSNVKPCLKMKILALEQAIGFKANPPFLPANLPQCYVKETFSSGETVMGQSI